MLLNLIDKFLIDRSRERSDSHYPSELTSCVRQLFYKHKKYEPSNSIEAGAIWKAEMGNAIHDRIARILKDMKLQVLDEVPFNKKVKGLDKPISGRIDNVFIDKEGRLSGVEIKTSYGRGILEIKKKRMPQDSALFQVCCYLLLTDITKFYLIYIGRDNAYRTEFIFTKDKDNSIFMNNRKLDLTSSTIFGILMEVEEALNNNNIPDRPYKALIKNGEVKDKIQKNKETYSSDWQCRYCAWKDTCWREVLEQSIAEGKIFLGKEVL